ncbi:MAG: hypothetical protein Cons2KO_13970 [Congregibacter sp.]
MSVFRLIKYSSIIYFLGRHKNKLFRSVAVLLFAFVTSLLYDDVRQYLESQHPGTLIYALAAKIIIVYGSLAFVLWQFRGAAGDARGQERAKALAGQNASKSANQSTNQGKSKGRKFWSKQTATTAGDDKANVASGSAQHPSGSRLDALADIDTHASLKSRYDSLLGEPSEKK